MECGNDDKLKESCIIQANGVIISDEPLIMDGYGGGDQCNSRYVLTHNPVKFGGEFTFLRELSGPMRRHAIKKNNEAHLCKERGRWFEVMRSMFSHMESKKQRVIKMSSIVEENEHLSELENFCLIWRKISMINYKGTMSPSFLGTNAAHCDASELDDAEGAAR